jgi:ABC-type transport system substrate-binding protein
MSSLRALVVALVAVFAAMFAAGTAAAQEPPRKVLKLAFRVAETSLDPAKIVDIYSRTITPHIFEALYTYDHLARPAKIKPKLAAGMPEHSPDIKVWTVKLRPGIYFADDPAFKGSKREVVAQDVVYAFQRIADPANKSPNWGVIDASAGFVGLAEQRKAAIDGKKPFDFDAPLEGLKALDRYTVREPRPRFDLLLAAPEVYGAQATDLWHPWVDGVRRPVFWQDWYQMVDIVPSKKPKQ